MQNIKRSVGSLLEEKYRRPSLICSLVKNRSDENLSKIKCLYGFQPKPRKEDILIRADVKPKEKPTQENLFVSIDTEGTGQVEIYSSELQKILNEITENNQDESEVFKIKIGVFLSIDKTKYHTYLSNVSQVDGTGLLFKEGIEWENICEAYTTTTITVNREEI